MRHEDNRVKRGWQSCRKHSLLRTLDCQGFFCFGGGGVILFCFAICVAGCAAESQFISQNEKYNAIIKITTPSINQIDPFFNLKKNFKKKSTTICKSVMAKKTIETKYPMKTSS
jgi:hypothetical protein